MWMSPMWRKRMLRGILSPSDWSKLEDSLRLSFRFSMQCVTQSAGMQRTDAKINVMLLLASHVCGASPTSGVDISLAGLSGRARGAAS